MAIVVGALAILSAWIFGKTFELIVDKPIWWLDTPAVMGFFGAYWGLLDRAAWRWRLGPLRFSTHADLSGVWDGIIESSFNERTTVEAVLYIKQSYSRILIELHTKDSRSRSEMAAISGKFGTFTVLRYNFINDPRPLAHAAMLLHRGYVALELIDNARLEGDYSTDRHRGNYGRMSFTRRKNKAG
ncbi:MAG: hypothetical protein ACRDRY_22165 [Pseudonocardiaceae bacterium]